MHNYIEFINFMSSYYTLLNHIHFLPCQLVLHLWGDEDCINILAQCKKVIPSREAGGKVIIIDIVVDSSSGQMFETQLLMDMAMMVYTRGRQRDENEWSSIFAKAGFSDYKIVKKLGARGVIEVYP